jgi:hypothetical protein
VRSRDGGRDNIESVVKIAPPDIAEGGSPTLCENNWAAAERQDLLRRFTATPYQFDLQLMQRTIRLETNSQPMLTLARRFFEHHQYGRARAPEFFWRIVCETDPQVLSSDPPLIAFSDLGLRYVNAGQRGFLAVDLEKREAAGFLADLFIDGGPGFRNHRPLDLLFCMTAPSLGLTALSGGCVGVKDRGVLVFGPPNSGKTTACYLAAKAGMEFHADQAVFLDMRDDRLRAWGDLFPAVFRPETLEFLPELRGSTRPSSHAGLSFYYFDKTPLQARRARPVSPVCSVFLERGAASEPQLNEIARDEAVSRLRNCLLFEEDARFEGQIATALNALASKPVYSLQYDRDPKTATEVLATVVQNRKVMATRRHRQDVHR